MIMTTSVCVLYITVIAKLNFSVTKKLIMMYYTRVNIIAYLYNIK